MSSLVTTEDVVDELVKGGALCSGVVVDVYQLADKMLRSSLKQFSSAKVNKAIGAVQQHPVAIKCPCGHTDSLMLGGHLQHGVGLGFALGRLMPPTKLLCL